MTLDQKQSPVIEIVSGRFCQAIVRYLTKEKTLDNHTFRRDATDYPRGRIAERWWRISPRRRVFWTRLRVPTIAAKRLAAILRVYVCNRGVSRLERQIGGKHTQRRCVKFRPGYRRRINCENSFIFGVSACM